MNSKMFDHWRPVKEILAVAVGGGGGGGFAGPSICSEWGRRTWGAMWWLPSLWLLWGF